MDDPANPTSNTNTPPDISGGAPPDTAPATNPSDFTNTWTSPPASTQQEVKPEQNTTPAQGPSWDISSSTTSTPPPDLQAAAPASEPLKPEGTSGSTSSYEPFGASSSPPVTPSWDTSAPATPAPTPVSTPSFNSWSTPSESGSTPTSQGVTSATPTEPAPVSETQFGADSSSPLASSFDLSSLSASPPTLSPASEEPTTASSGIEPIEPAPTDLSQLTENAGTTPSAYSEVYSPPVAAPETLVLPSSEGGGIPAEAVTTHSSGGIPKLAIIGAVLIILTVAAASAYFILGIGQQGAQSTSLPAVEQAPLTNPPTPAPKAVSAPTPEATGSSSTFGDLAGTPKPSSSPTSALELLKQRQQQQASPTP